MSNFHEMTYGYPPDEVCYLGHFVQGPAASVGGPFYSRRGDVHFEIGFKTSDKVFDVVALS
jgi:hypothetical protein